MDFQIAWLRVWVIHPCNCFSNDDTVGVNTEIPNSVMYIQFTEKYFYTPPVTLSCSRQLSAFGCSAKFTELT